MKKIWVAVVFGILCACATTEKSGITDLDTAVKQASKDINDSLPDGARIVLLNFNSDSDAFSGYVIEEMSIALLKEGKLTVVDQTEIDSIRSEMNFRISGDISDEAARQIGMMLGAQFVVSGSLIYMGEVHRFRTKTIDVPSAAIQASSSISINDDPQIRYLLGQGKTSAPQTTVAGDGALAPSVQTDSEYAAPAVSAAPPDSVPIVYNIGDTGPAGGLIFYDKGNNLSGWRYLEAAPVEAEFQAIWSVSTATVEAIQPDIGSGRRNTQIIVEAFKLISAERNTAAQMVSVLTFNGFDDWFMPSQAELDQMYGKLRRERLGDFKDERYWSSTGTTQNFSDGQMSRNPDKSNRNYIRPIRQVPGSNPNSVAQNSTDYYTEKEGTTTGLRLGLGARLKSNPNSNLGKILTSILGVLVVGGVVALMIWGPSSAH